MSLISISLLALAGSGDFLCLAEGCLSRSAKAGSGRSIFAYLLRTSLGKGVVNNSQLPVPFVAPFSFDTIKVKLIDSYH